MDPVCAKPKCTKNSKSFKSCSACRATYHTMCGEYSTYKDKRPPYEKRFLCFSCSSIPANVQGLKLQHKSRSNSGSSQASVKRKIDELEELSSESDDEDEEPDLKTILREIRKSGKETKKLALEVKTLNTSFSTRCSSLEMEVNDLKNQMTDLKLAHEKEMDYMRSKINSLEAQSQTEVYIHGHLHSGSDEFDPNLAVSQIAEFLDVEVPTTAIKSSRVIPRKIGSPQAQQKFTPIVAVDFFSHSTAARLVEAKRKFGRLTNKDLLQSEDDKPIAISFPLSRDQYLLMKETKTRAQIHQFRFVWNSKGAIFVRKAEGARAIKVNNFKDLDILMPTSDYQPQSTSTATPMETATINPKQ